MKPITIQDIRRATGARLLAPPPADPPIVEAISTDSRAAPPNSLFVAIPGEKFDGHDFVAAAAGRGAVAAIVERSIDPPPDRCMLLKVDSARAALGKLGRLVREQLRPKVKVIAVAGSNGKTGTKHLIDSALSPSLSGTISPKSFNNDIGVPTTVFAARATDDYLVLEMGTNHPGEIRALTHIGAPDIAVITNCGPEHLEFLGSVDGVRRENASIIEGLNPRGLLVVNGDDRALLEAVREYPGRRVTFGFDRANDLFASDVETGDMGVSFRLNGSRQQQCFVPLLGRHTACNALAAIAVARRLGLDEQRIREALAHASGPEMRLQMQEICGVRVLNDAYNANPASMAAAIDTFASLSAAGRKIMVLGDMLELGPDEAAHHRDVGTLAAGAKPDLIVCVGDRSKSTADAAARAGIAASAIRWYADARAAAAEVPMLVREGDLLLLKGSRGIRLEEIAKAMAMKAAA